MRRGMTRWTRCEIGHTSGAAAPLPERPRKATLFAVEAWRQTSRRRRMKAPSRTPRPAADTESAAAPGADDAPTAGRRPGPARLGPVHGPRARRGHGARGRHVAAQRVARDRHERHGAQQVPGRQRTVPAHAQPPAQLVPAPRRARRAGLSEEDAHAALALLVHDLSPEARHAAIDEMLRCMRAGYQASGQAEPGWIDGIIERFPLPVEPAPRRHRVNGGRGFVSRSGPALSTDLPRADRLRGAGPRASAPRRASPRTTRIPVHGTGPPDGLHSLLPPGGLIPS